MAITTLAMVATVFVLNLYFNGDKPVPRWAKILVIKHISRMLCMCNCYGTDSSPVIKTAKTNDNNVKYGAIPRHHHDRNKNKYGNILSKHIPADSEECIPMTSLPERIDYEPEASCDPDIESEPEVVFTEHVNSVPSHEIRAPTVTKLDHTKDWKRVAEVFDRFFFALSLVAIVATTLLLFHPITDFRSHAINIHDKPSVTT